MTTRELTAETTGPVTIDASLLEHGGVISVRAVAGCDRATLTVSTTDETGVAANAVREATLYQQGGTLSVSVRGKGGSGAGGTTIITGGGRGRVQTIIANNSGSSIQIGGNFYGGNIVSGSSEVWINGVQVSGSATVVTGAAPIEIVAVVPPGSTVIGHTESADVEAIGSFARVSGDTQSGSVRADVAEKVTASTQSGSVTVTKAANINARTMSGAVQLNMTDVVDAHTMSGAIDIRDFGGTARLKTMSGAIRVHATAGGDIDANSMSGSIDVTATQAALDELLDVRPRSMSGRISVPSNRTSGDSPRRRRSF
ncbi:DUF4097 family beta strand repeat-containing protein [Streptomyces sp. NPDC089922]|uniref:DUF4097 family beta strand repeat-containing protein n=1 Tax=Streptomyces sp. NPDC089922 TaxID=3155189 RepID=UPI003443996E